MLNMGFREDIETVLGYMPEEHQTVLFSATMPKEIMDITKRYQKDAVTIRVVKKELTVKNIEQYYFDIRRKDKLDVLTRFWMCMIRSFLWFSAIPSIWWTSWRMSCRTADILPRGCTET